MTGRLGPICISPNLLSWRAPLRVSCRRAARYGERPQATHFQNSARREKSLGASPTLDIHELDGLPRNERQKLYMDGNHELYCLYFGDLANCFGQTEFRV
jgi:hypothetical protein